MTIGGGFPYHSTNHHHIRSHMFANRKIMHQTHYPHRQIKAVDRVACTSRWWVDFESKTNKKQSKCKAVEAVPLTGCPFFEFVF